MNILYLFGLQTACVRPELEIIIRKDILYQSKGCEKILKLIATKN